VTRVTDGDSAKVFLRDSQREHGALAWLATRKKIMSKTSKLVLIVAITADIVSPVLAQSH
jgi:hypothetical protein